MEMRIWRSCAPHVGPKWRTRMPFATRWVVQSRTICRVGKSISWKLDWLGYSRNWLLRPSCLGEPWQPPVVVRPRRLLVRGVRQRGPAGGPRQGRVTGNVGPTLPTRSSTVRLPVSQPRRRPAIPNSFEKVRLTSMFSARPDSANPPSP